MPIASLMNTLIKRRHLLAATGLMALSAVVSPVQAQAQTSANLAMIGEPQSLDPMASTADLVSLIMQHVYEPLYTFDAQWGVKPMLAADMPKMSADGKTYTIDIRKGVKLHNGRELDAEDVVASLKRWVEMTPRGKSLGKSITSLSAKGSHVVEIVLSDVQPALLAQPVLN